MLDYSRFENLPVEDSMVARKFSSILFWSQEEYSKLTLNQKDIQVDIQEQIEWSEEVKSTSNMKAFCSAQKSRCIEKELDSSNCWL